MAALSLFILQNSEVTDAFRQAEELKAGRLTSDCNLSCFYPLHLSELTDGEADATEKSAAVFLICWLVLLAAGAVSSHLSSAAGTHTAF